MHGKPLALVSAQKLLTITSSNCSVNLVPIRRVPKKKKKEYHRAISPTKKYFYMENSQVKTKVKQIKSNRV